MRYQNCSSSYADSLSPNLGGICSNSTFLLFMSFLNSSILRNDVISGSCSRVKPVARPRDEYDFIVVGGGAGGAVVTARLSENPHWKVLLIEAGPDEPPGAAIPSFVGQFLGTKLDWNYTTTNEKHACLSTNGRCNNKAGKNLGGNTAHNGMAYMRGNPTDYNNWAAMGNDGWSWDEVKPFFLKSENNGEIERVGKLHHATGGPLHVQRFPYSRPFMNTMIAAAKEAGYPITKDHNGDETVGYSIMQATNLNGVRQSAATAFLRPARNRNNLHILLDSQVTRIIVKNDRAVGVEYVKKGKLRRVNAKREVIVAGGAVGSPRVLLNSGIGPRKHLESVGVKVIKNLPGVGKNFHNHVDFQLSFTVDEPDVYDNDLKAAEEYIQYQTGPVSTRGLSISANLASSATTPDFPDLQIYHFGYVANCAPGEVGALRSEGKRSVSISSAYTHVKSRGSVSLASNDPLEMPVIHGNYFSDPNDVERVIEGLEIILKVSQTEPLKALNFTLTTKPIDACSHLEFLSHEYFTCAIPQVGYPDNHQAGSCKMGNSSDPLAVVDSRLRVYGIKGLRVADASIMPQVTSANTAAPTMMIGERVADFIKKDWVEKHAKNECSECLCKNPTDCRQGKKTCNKRDERN